MFALLPFMRVDGKAYVYNRENGLGGVDFLDPNDTINESASTFTEKTATLKILAGDVDIDKFLRDTMSDTNSQVAAQLAGKAKQMRRTFQMTLRHPARLESSGPRFRWHDPDAPDAVQLRWR